MSNNQKKSFLNLFSDSAIHTSTNIVVLSLSVFIYGIIYTGDQGFTHIVSTLADLYTTQHLGILALVIVILTGLLAGIDRLCVDTPALGGFIKKIINVVYEEFARIIVAFGAAFFCGLAYLGYNAYSRAMPVGTYFGLCVATFFLTSLYAAVAKLLIVEP